MAYIPNSNSVVAFQSDPTKLVGTVSVVGGVSITNLPTTQNISGSVVASGSVTALQGTNPWFVQLTSGSVATTGGNSSVMLTPGINTIGSVAALQATNPWIVQLTSGSVITTGGNSSVMLMPSGNSIGSVTALQGTNPWVVSGTVTTSGGNSSVQVLAGNATIGSVTALQGTNPWVTVGSVQGTMSILGTVPVTQSGIWATSIVGVPQPHSVSGVGTFAVTQSGTWATSIVGVPNPHSVSGVGLFNVNHTGNGSIITTFSNSPSIVGTYAEDAAHTSADKGVFTLGVRNDTVASFVSANGDYTPVGLDSAGRTITKPFSAEESRIEGYNSVVSTSVTTLVAAAGAGLRNYITDFFVANTGATTTLITFKDGSGSVLGYTIAPTGGGSNGTGIATPIRTGANATFDFQPTSASSIIYATVKGFKAP